MTSLEQLRELVIACSAAIDVAERIYRMTGAPEDKGRLAMANTGFDMAMEKYIYAFAENKLSLMYGIGD